MPLVLGEGRSGCTKKIDEREPSFTWIAASVSTPSPASTIAPTKGTLKSSCSSAPTGRPRAPAEKDGRRYRKPHAETRSHRIPGANRGGE